MDHKSFKTPKTITKAQDEFKKIEHTMIQTIPGTVSLSQVDIWFQDEGRFGQQNTTSRIWVKTGTRPRAVQQQQFEYAYMYGAVCPATGETEAIITPLVSKEMMIQHLSQISEKTEAGRYAVLIMDGAGWHTDDIAFEFDNLSIIKLPPYSPELNPIEQVWQWLRQHHLANRCFKNYEDIVEQCTQAWFSFIKYKETVKPYALETEQLLMRIGISWGKPTRSR
ncbi:IS630 family transposase [Psychrobium sp. 1_MG-2023]|uniref:IS630 family transposase n=1 Tax=Psychrobium sp. 1_MG-2023 TaxID=3062624 RepID=UPI002732747B|nr:IS630 family transposase [Psychrobium sp. 1_MG-2023]MDP2559924.1 IS630 family transposase [Psychrobium sp. 1_MG-2023]